MQQQAVSTGFKIYLTDIGPNRPAVVAAVTEWWGAPDSHPERMVAIAESGRPLVTFQDRSDAERLWAKLASAGATVEVRGGPVADPVNALTSLGVEAGLYAIEVQSLANALARSLRQRPERWTEHLRSKLKSYLNVAHNSLNDEFGPALHDVEELIEELEPSAFAVVLVDPGPNKDAVVQAVQELSGHTLADAQRFVECAAGGHKDCGSGRALVTSLDRKDADIIAGRLRAVGATVRVEVV